MIRLLMVSYDYPPVGGIHIQRLLKFVKYLPEFGVEPIVFTKAYNVGYLLDQSNLELDYVQKTKVYKLGGTRLRRYHEIRHSDRRTQHPYLYYLGLKYIWFIDIFSAWYHEVKQDIVRVVRDEHIDCVFTTSPPHSTHLFGLYLKTKLGYPWVMDLRDAIGQVSDRKRSVVTFLQQVMEAHYEKRFSKYADVITTVSEPILENMQRRTGIPVIQKGSIIHNGFDPEDFDDIQPLGSVAGKFVVTYTGTFRGRRTPQFFVEAITTLVRRGEIDPADLVVRVIGYVEPDKRKMLEALAEYCCVEMLGFVEHRQALSHQAGSDLLLLVLAPDVGARASEVMTGKIFEYMGASRPVLALAPEGPLRQLIEEGRFGWVVPPHNVEDIAQGFAQIYSQWKLTGALDYAPDPEVRASYDRRALAERLAQVVTRISRKPGLGPR